MNTPSSEALKQVFLYFLRTSVPRMTDEQKKRILEKRKEETA